MSILSDTEIESLGIVARAHFFDNILKAQDLHTAKEVNADWVKRIEALSHRTNTNMYGISLSRDEWQQLKKDIGAS